MSRLLKESAVVYKKALNGFGDHVIVKLRLPKGTRVNLSLSSGLKNRADQARVLAIETLSGKLLRTRTATSDYSADFKYKVGALVKPEAAFSRSSEACHSGIHFFSTRAGAENYPL